MTGRIQGVVVSYNDDRGFGFIRPDDGSADCFVQFTEIHVDGFRTLAINERVEFEPVSVPAGRQALNVRGLR